MQPLGFRFLDRNNPADPGIDINTIRAWLGHVSIDTTNVYAEVDLQREAEILKHSTALSTTSSRHCHWRDDPSLILRSL